MSASAQRYGNDRRNAEGMFLNISMFCMLLAPYCDAEKTRTAAIIAAVFFLPKKTTASAVQPIPLEIFGTKEEILRLRKEPASEPSTVAVIHAKRRMFVTFVPFE